MTLIWQAIIISDDDIGRSLEGRWNIVSGIGIYANFHGNGTVNIIVNWATTEVDVMLAGAAHFDQRKS